MHRYPALLLIVPVLLLGACQSFADVDPVPTAGSGGPPAATATPAEQAGPAPTLEPLFLEVSSPEDEATVFAASVEVTGRTVPDALVTVNGAVASVGGDGGFSAAVALDSGANYIEVIASTPDGEEAVGLSVIYLD